MKTIIDLNHPGAFGTIIDEIHRKPFILQLTSVFVLMAAPTREGAKQLDKLKTRQPNKNYGTAIGNLGNFLSCANKDLLPDGFTSSDQYEKLKGSFVRVHFGETNFNTPVIRHGTHQGLILDGILQELFMAIEASFSGTDNRILWAGHYYYSPLCTSCNISGDPMGSITDFDRAVEFAETRNVDLLVTGEQAQGQQGSYPIFGMYRSGIEIHRNGPNMEEIMSVFPPEKVSALAGS